MIVAEHYNCTPSEAWGAVKHLIRVGYRRAEYDDLKAKCKWCSRTHRKKDLRFFIASICGRPGFLFHPGPEAMPIQARIEYVPVTGLFNVVIYDNV